MQFAFFTFLMLTLAASAYGLESKGTVGYVAEYTDNSVRTEIGEISDLIHRPNASIYIGHDGASIEANADYTISQRIYDKAKFADETIVEGTGSLYWHSTRDRLQLNLTNTRTQRTLNSRSQNTPSNRQLIDQSIIEGIFSQPVFANHFLRAAASFENVDADESETNSERERVSLGYVIPQPDEGELSVSISRSNIDFDDVRSVDYTAEAIEIRYLSQIGRMSVDSLLGYTEIDQSEARKDFGQETGRIDLELPISDVTSFSLGLSRSVADNTLGQPTFSEDSFRSGVVDNSGLNEIFVDTRASIGGETRIGRQRISLDVFASNVNYEEALEDEKRRGVNLRISRQLSSRIRAAFRATKTNFDFVDLNRKARERELELSFDYQASRRLQMSLAVEQFVRDSDLDVDPDITVNSIFLSIEYILFGENIDR